MTKEQKEFENQKCECGHYRSTHNGIYKFCYHPDCKCIEFKIKI